VLNFLTLPRRLPGLRLTPPSFPWAPWSRKAPICRPVFDLLLAHRFSRDFCAGKAVYLLPVFPFSTAMETRGVLGTVSLRQQTLWDVISDIASNLVRHGFKRLVVLDFSNYNWILKHAVRELNLNRESIQAVWGQTRKDVRQSGGGTGDVAGLRRRRAVETSLALSLRPQAVFPSLEDSGSQFGPENMWTTRGWGRVAPKGFGASLPWAAG